MMHFCRKWFLTIICNVLFVICNAHMFIQTIKILVQEMKTQKEHLSRCAFVPRKLSVLFVTYIVFFFQRTKKFRSMKVLSSAKMFPF